jgi:hypothetical protein
MGIRFLARQLGLEALPGIKPQPSAYAGSNDAESNAADDPGIHDPGTSTHAAQWRLRPCLLYAPCRLLQFA